MAGSLAGQRRHSARGFTLVELLVALFAMAVLAALSWQGVDGMLRTRSATAAAVDRALRMNTVLTQWEQDIAAVQATDAVPALQFDGRTLRLTRHSAAGLQVVAWSVRDGQWWRWAAPAVTRVDDLQQQWLTSQQLLGGEPGHLKLMDGAQDWQLYFYRGNAWSNAQSSGDLGNRASSGGSGGSADAIEQLPEGVRFVLTLPGGPLTRDLLVPAQPQ